MSCGLGALETVEKQQKIPPSDFLLATGCSPVCTDLVALVLEEGALVELRVANSDSAERQVGREHLQQKPQPLLFLTVSFTFGPIFVHVGDGGV